MTGTRTGPASIRYLSDSKGLQHTAFEKSVFTAAITADGRIALTGRWDGLTRAWDTASGKPLGPYIRHQSIVSAVAFSGDGKLALTASEDGIVQLWDTSTGKLVGPRLQDRGVVRAVALSTDASISLIAAVDKPMVVWSHPRILTSDPERIKLWMQVNTGMEIDESGAVRFLDAKTWQERRQSLQQLGGPPISD